MLCGIIFTEIEMLLQQNVIQLEPIIYKEHILGENINLNVAWDNMIASSNNTNNHFD